MKNLIATVLIAMSTTASAQSNELLIGFERYVARAESMPDVEKAWFNGNDFWAIANDDGTNKNHLASSICIEMQSAFESDGGAEGYSVYILGAEQFELAHGVILGEADC